ncbi:50S ribosomal protein L24 [Wandonia haliotis]|uniref:Large ribosomal subunit protein uL24 n=1 Tax=Wandonia haliotis TaxID=574963 RepID=A0ABN1MUN2_9FLAO
MQKKLHIKVGDTVQVMSGESKGQSGKVIAIDRKKDRALVEGVNVIKKHVKPSAANPQGGIVEQEAGIHISNLLLVVDGQPTRIGRRADANGKLVRYSKKTGEEIK